MIPRMVLITSNSNKAHTVPFRIEILSSSWLYLVSSEEYSEVTIDDDEDVAEVRDPPFFDGATTPSIVRR